MPDLLSQSTVQYNTEVVDLPDN